MLFITNHVINEPDLAKVEQERTITFKWSNSRPSTSVLFCRREDDGRYQEIGSWSFMGELKKSAAEQILFYIHGFSNQPEPDIFPRARALQKLFDGKQANLVQVVPLIWPCDNDMGIIKDYWDDQRSADASAFGFSRVLEMFLDWRSKSENELQEPPCLKRINILAHSMGNRVLRGSLENLARYRLGGEVPLLFRNVFLVAADIVNESLEEDQGGRFISDSARNVSVYFASDDLALRASKVSNLKNKVASRRLGHTGPENMDRVPGNIYSIDCDNLNTDYDYPKGHSYFTFNKGGKTAGLVFNHIFNSVESGRVKVDDSVRRTTVLGKS
ncbi:MAG: alpha/beta hydrolase [Panacagrimonas sp.]